MLINFCGLIGSFFNGRKKSVDGVSTLEAVAALLGQVENDPEKYASLNSSLEQMMKFQIEAMGEETFNKHFADRIN